MTTAEDAISADHWTGAEPVQELLEEYVLPRFEGDGQDELARKHPMLFQACDAAVVNKIDIAAAVDTDVNRMLADIEQVAADVPAFPTSVTEGTGLPAVFDYLDHVRESGHMATDHERYAQALSPSEQSSPSAEHGSEQ